MFLIFKKFQPMYQPTYINDRNDSNDLGDRSDSSERSDTPPKKIWAKKQTKKFGPSPKKSFLDPLQNFFFGLSKK